MRVGRVVCSLLLPLAVLLIAATIVFPAAPAGKVFRFQPKEGGAAAYDTKLSSRAEGKGDGGERVRAEVSLQMRCVASYLGGTASGGFGLRGAIESGAMKVKVDGREQELDLPEYVERYTVTERGEMKSQSVVSGEPPVVAYGGVYLAVTPDEPILLGGLAIFPERPLRKGDKWKGTARVPLPQGGKYNDWSYQSVLVGEETWRGRKCHRVKTTSSTTLSQTADAPDGSGTIRMSGKVTSTDNWLFDSERGIIVYSQRSARVQTAMSLVSDGEVVRTQTTSGVLNEKNVLVEYDGSPVGAK
ncbi:MAG: hypothetical protein ACE149_05125 [Armatimonadota bacterium]